MQTLAENSLSVIGAGPGAEIRGIDLSQKLDESTFACLEDAYNRNSVIVIRGQRLTPEQQITFSRRFGELVHHMLKQFLLPGHPEILVVSNVIENGKPIGQADAGHHWHTDMSFTAEPPRGSILYALEVPVQDGQVLGDTMFASTADAYDALPESMKRKLEGLRAAHDWSNRYRAIEKSDHNAGRDDAKEKSPEVVHPVVRTHPLTGRKCIYVNSGFTSYITGMPEAEGRALLEQLWAHCARPEFVYRHRWQVGDVIMWDNCAALHYAIPDYKPPLRRRMHRTTLKGWSAR